MAQVIVKKASLAVEPVGMLVLMEAAMMPKMADGSASTSAIIPGKELSSAVTTRKAIMLKSTIPTPAGT